MQKEDNKKKALQVSIKEGNASAIATGIAETQVVPFALALNASSFQIGLLNSLAGLISPLAQLYGDKLMENHSRKTIVRRFVFWQSILWLALISFAFLFWKGFFVDSLPILFIIAYTLLAALGGIAYPAWFSWMGDLVPEKERGKYFGKRHKITGFFGLIATLIGGLILDISKTHGLVLFGFSIIFFIAFIARMTSYSYFRKQYSPKFKLERKYYFSIWSFIKRFDNFGKFAVYNAFFNLVLMIASPFFAVYMLKELNFSYLTFTIISMSSSIFILIFAPLSGKFADKYGNRKLFSLGCLLFSINPFLWMVFKAPVILILVQAISGLANAAHMLAITNFTYDSTSQKHRALCITYTNILAGIGVFIGSLFGGFLVNYWRPSSLGPFMFVFLISGIGRLAVSLFLVPRIKEQKKVMPLKEPKINIMHPIKTFQHEVSFIKRFFLVV